MVITNSGPLIALAKLGFLDVLGRLYEKVMMPGLFMRKWSPEESQGDM